MHKVVLDTNQFVSGVITKSGTSAKLLQAWRDSAYILITSGEILEELSLVLRYPHIIRRYRLNEADVNSLFDLIQQEAVVLSDVPKVDVIKDDPEDNKIIACALETKAQDIVSGDRHLLALRRHKSISIVTAAQFLEIIKYED